MVVMTCEVLVAVVVRVVVSVVVTVVVARATTDSLWLIGPLPE